MSTCNAFVSDQVPGGLFLVFGGQGIGLAVWIEGKSVVKSIATLAHFIGKVVD